MKTVIITGADGFIGRKLTAFLSKKNIKIYALVHEKIEMFASKNVTEIPFDLGSIFDVKEYLPKNADALFHLAWSGVNCQDKNVFRKQFENVEYSLDVLKLAKLLSVKKIIYPGSVSEYAYSNEIVTGKNIPSPSDCYSAAKVATHFACDLYARKNDISFIWLLISSAYGPGRDDDTNLIYYTIKTLLSGDKPNFTRLEQLWDFIYIEDLISALYLVGYYGKGREVYPVGSGENRTLLDYVYIIRDLIDSELELGIGEYPYKTNKIDNSIVDISKLCEDTGYKPKHTFENGIKKTIDYYRNDNISGFMCKQPCCN